MRGDLDRRLERDESTRVERQEAQDPAAYDRRPPLSRLDMLTGPVPGTDLILGLSRRLFAACRSLAAQQARILFEVQADLPDLVRTAAAENLDEDETDDLLRQRRAAFAEREAGERDVLRAATRQAYEIARGFSWAQLLNAEPPLVAETPVGLLEGATPDTYLAIQAAQATSAAGLATNA